VDTSRDLARSDPWRESLERSRARRESVVRSQNRTQLRWPTIGPRGALALRPRGLAALTTLAALIAAALSAGGPQASPPTARADARSATLGGAPPRPRAAAASPARGCPQAVAPAGYVNPLVGAVVKPERIDQGVDYAGSGTLVAIGTARITNLASSGSGWPGAFIEYRLLSGADAGCFVYYAEGVIPARTLWVGETVDAGQPLATIVAKWPTGIEIGWGAGVGDKAYAKVAGQWSALDDQDNRTTVAGRTFSALIAALSGPPGKVEGSPDAHGSGPGVH